MHQKITPKLQKIWCKNLVKKFWCKKLHQRYKYKAMFTNKSIQYSKITSSVIKYVKSRLQKQKKRKKWLNKKAPKLQIYQQKL